MSVTPETIVFQYNDFEFTACCGSVMQKDLINSCIKCERPIEKVYGKEDALQFAHEIWYVTLKGEFLRTLGEMLISEGSSLHDLHPEDKK